MQIRKLELYNFRNYDNLKLNFSDNINLIFGNNGVGKTNLIEAIYVLAITKSFRTKNEKILIKDNTLESYIEGEIHSKKTTKYKIILSANGKKAKINNVIKSKLSDYISNVNVILFNPDDLLIIKDTPNFRRKFLNCEISQLNNEYLNLLNKYNVILKNRNFYLRTMYINKMADKNYLDLLTKKLIESGLKIFEYRKNYIEDINENLAKYYKKISTKDGLKIRYLSDYNKQNEEQIFNKYKKTLEKDIVLGKTQIGIHHDDYFFSLLSKNLKEYGSEGQKKNAIIALKMAEIDIFKKRKQEYPILILDDLFSALDKRKINNIIKLLKKKVQVFITVTDLANLQEKLLANSKIYKITNGKVEECKNES